MRLARRLMALSLSLLYLPTSVMSPSFALKTNSSASMDSRLAKKRPMQDVSMLRSQIMAGHLSKAEEGLLSCLESPKCMAEAAIALAVFYRLEGRSCEAELFARRGLADAQSKADVRRQCEALRELGAALRDQGQYDEGIEYLKQALILSDTSKVDRNALMLSTLTATIKFAVDRNKAASAEQAIAQAQMLANKVENSRPELVAEFLLVCAECASSQRETNRAEFLYLDCLKLSRKSTATALFIPMVLARQAEIKYDAGDLPSAEKLFRASIELREAGNNVFASSNSNWMMQQAFKFRQEVSASRMEDWLFRLNASLVAKKNANTLGQNEKCLISALALTEQRQFAKAADILKASIDAGEFSSTKAKLLTAELLLAEIICEQKDFALAKKHYDTAISIAEESQGKDYKTVADLLEREAVQSQRCESSQPVARNLLRCLDIRTKLYGPDDPLVAETELLISIYFASMGNRGENLAVSALKKLNKVLVEDRSIEGKKAYDAYLSREGGLELLAKRNATLLLAAAYVLAGFENHKDAGSAGAICGPFVKYSRTADPHYTLALRSALGEFLRREGDFAFAMLEFQEGLALAKQLKSLKWQQAFLKNLAKISRDQNDLLMAYRYLTELPANPVKAFKESSSVVKTGSDCLTEEQASFELADLLIELDDIEAAKSVLSQAQSHGIESANSLAEFELALVQAKLLAKEHEDSQAAGVLDSVISSLKLQSDPDAAKLCGQALLLRGQLAGATADTFGAKIFLAQAFELGKRQNSMSAYKTMCESLVEIANIASREGDFETASRAARQCTDLVYLYLTNSIGHLSFSEQANLVSLSEIAKSAYFTHCSNDLDLLLAYNKILPFKGLLTETLRRENRISKNWKDVWTPDIPNKLKLSRSEVARIHSELSNSINPDSKQLTAALTALDNQERSERQLLAGVSAASLSVDPAIGMSVRKLLGKGECFVDVYKYQSAVNKKLYYAAIVSSADVKVKRIELGTADEIENALNVWLLGIGADAYSPFKATRSENGSQSKYLHLRDAEPPKDELERLAAVSKKTTDDAWNTLMSATVNKIRTAIPKDTVQITLSPDSELARLPWHSAFLQLPEALVLLDSPRHLKLLRGPTVSPPAQASLPSQPSPGGHKLALVGDVKFNNPEVGSLTKTGKEVLDIAKTFVDIEPKPVPVCGVSATRSKVLQMLPGANIVHLATHGYFTPNRFSTEALNCRAFSKLSCAEFVGLVLSKRTPLLESGLLLAEDENSPSTINEGLSRLTAQDILESDLSSCRLMVLSACQTALGRLPTGQGVMGLHSASAAAGARCMVMSLWKVDDDATEAFMSHFYQRLAAGESPHVALKASQEFVQRQSEKGWDKPFYWAAWQLIGE